MPTYNLLEYAESYSMKSGSLWNHQRDEVNDSANEIVANVRVSSSKKIISEPFQYKTKVMRKTA